MNMRRYALGLVLAAGLLSACGGGGDQPAPSTAGLGAGFNQARGFNASVHILTAANDGTGAVYVGGQFTSYSSTEAKLLVRLKADGTVDTHFNIGTGFTVPAPGFASLHGVALAADGSGKIYVWGGFSEYNGQDTGPLLRLNADGSLDTSFSYTRVSENSRIEHVAPMSTGQVYLAGNFSGAGAPTSLIRLGSNGQIDTTFNPAANADPLLTFDAIGLAADATDAGAVYVWGWVGSTSPQRRLVRLSSAGTIDSSFDAPFDPSFGFEVNAITASADGNSVYVGGCFTHYKGIEVNHIVKLNRSGAPEPTFVSGSAFDGCVDSIILAGAGSSDVYARGRFGTYNAAATSGLARLSSTGNLSAAFPRAGGPVWAAAAALDGSNDVFVGGAFVAYDGKPVSHFARLNSDASIDTSTARGAGFTANAERVTPAGDGSGDVFVVGYHTYNGEPMPGGLAKLHSNGTRDTSFDLGPDFVGYPEAVTPVNDGSGDIFVGSLIPMSIGTRDLGRLVRLNRFGAVVSPASFDPAIREFGAGVFHITPVSDGSGDIYVGGLTAPYQGLPSHRILRLRNDGSLVSSFDTGAGFNGAVSQIALARDGSGDIFVGGFFNAYTRGGTVYPAGGLVRLTNRGAVRGEFDTRLGFNHQVLSIAPAADGSVYVTGRFTSYGGSTGLNRLIKLNPLGAPDFSFDVSTGLNGPGLRLVLATDGSADVFVCGNFTTYQGRPAHQLLRLHANGSVNETFATGTGFYGAVENITLATDGSGDLFVVGAFTRYQTTTVGHIARLNPDGSLD